MKCVLLFEQLAHADLKKQTKKGFSGVELHVLEINMDSCMRNIDCEHHRLFNEIISMGVHNIKCHFYKFASVVMDLYVKGNFRYGLDVKHVNDLTCFLYITKTNRIQHLNSVAGKYIFLRRPEGERNPIWTILLTFSPIPETRAFYYVGMDLFAHRENANEQLGLRYYINVPFYIRVTTELFLFAKTLKESLANEILFCMNDHINCGDDSQFVKQSINDLFGLESFVNADKVCKFEYDINDHLVVECACFRRENYDYFEQAKSMEMFDNPSLVTDQIFQFLSTIGGGYECRQCM